MEMPLTAQALYFHLGMRADDDGFISSPRQIMKAVECKQDDMKILISKGYVIPFNNGIVVIWHWKQHNYIQSDRYKKTVFKEEYQQLLLVDNMYQVNNECIQTGYITDTQDRLGKDRVRDSIELGDIICSEPEPTPSPSGILIPLNDKSLYDVPLDKIALWKETYPAVDVVQELRKMVAWSHSNPMKRKTRRGVDRFINSWLAKEQDRGGNRNTRQQSSEPTSSESYAPYHEMCQKYKWEPTPDDPFQ